MSADIWMPLYIGDYLADTRRLDTEQHGAYLLLIMDYWKNGPPPDNDQTLARIIVATESDWKRLRPVVELFFHVEQGRWTHKRIDRERARAKENAETFYNRAKSAAAARWNGKHKPSIASSNASSIPQAMLGTCPPSPSPSPSLEPHPETDTKEGASAAHFPEVKSSYHRDTGAVLLWLNAQTGAHFRETDANLALISARLSEPEVTVEGVRLMIDRQTKLWKGTEMAEYLRPNTLFGKQKFDNYYGQRDQPITQHQTNGRPGNRGFDRNQGTLNAGKAKNYDLSAINAGKLRPPVPNPGPPQA